MHVITLLQVLFVLHTGIFCLDLMLSIEQSGHGSKCTEGTLRAAQSARTPGIRSANQAANMNGVLALKGTLRAGAFNSFS